MNYRQAPQQQEETMMVQPIIVPLPGPVNLPIQFHGHMQQPHPQNNLRPPMPQHTQFRTIIMEQIPQRSPIPVSQHGSPQPHQLPLHPPMQNIIQQIIAQHEMAAAAQRQQQMTQQEEMAQHQHQEMIQRHHEMIRQQEIAQRQQEIAQSQHEEEHRVPEVVMAHRIPLPEEILSQVNRLPHQDVVVSVSEHEAEEVPQEDVRVVQHQRESAQEINGRQSYARGLPVHIPVPLMQQMQSSQPEESARPHCK